MPTTDEHLRWLRWAVVGVGIFVWVFSMLVPLQEFIFMYFQATGAIFTGGAGAVLIGGLYWKRGNTAGAWAAMIFGSTLSVLGVLINNIVWPRILPWAKEAYPDTEWLVMLPDKFWFNGVQIAFGVSLISLAIYTIVSLLTRSPGVDFDKLFHRGQYAVEAREGEPDYVPKTDSSSVPRWQRLFGVTEEFTLGDKIIYALKYLYFIWGFVVGLIGIIIAHEVFGMLQTDKAWGTWWTIWLYFTLTVGTITTIWFLIGGVKDLLKMFRQLKLLERDTSDDGTVRHEELLENGASELSGGKG